MARSPAAAWAWSAVAAGVLAGAVIVPWLATRDPSRAATVASDRRWAAAVVPEPGPEGMIDPAFVRPFDGDFPARELDQHRKTLHGEARASRWLARYHWDLPAGTPLYAVVAGEIDEAGPRELRVVGDDYTVTYEGVDAIVAEGEVVEAGERIAEATLSTFVLKASRAGGVGVDPYGAPWLWLPGEAPTLHAEATLPNLATVGSPFLDAVVRYVAWDDIRQPNAEWVDFHGEPRAPLDGVSFRTKAGDRFKFHRGDVVPPDGLVRVYSGDGEDGGGTYFWGRSLGAWDDRGDCLRLDVGERTVAEVGVGRACGAALPPTRRLGPAIRAAAAKLGHPFEEAEPRSPVDGVPSDRDGDTTRWDVGEGALVRSPVYGFVDRVDEVEGVVGIAWTSWGIDREVLLGNVWPLVHLGDRVDQGDLLGSTHDGAFYMSGVDLPDEP